VQLPGQVFSLPATHCPTGDAPTASSTTRQLRHCPIQSLALAVSAVVVVVPAVALALVMLRAVPVGRILGARPCTLALALQQLR
jgi:hypothetical protein